jgi:hypothetical protein
VVVHGGARPDGGSATLGDVWEWDGAAWAERPTTGGPRTRAFHQLVALPAGGLVCYGGTDGDALAEDDLWELDGSAWRRLDAPAPRPPLRTQHGAVWDPTRDAVLMCGGVGRGEVFGPRDLWSWSPRTGAWTRLDAGAAAPVQNDVVLAFDGQQVVYVAYGPDLSTWALNAEGWACRDRNVELAPRRWFAMGFDAGRSKLVLFGGCRWPRPADAPPELGELLER